MREPDALDLLVKDHIAICFLLEDLRRSPPMHRRAPWEELRERITRYLEAEEWVLQAASLESASQRQVRAVDVGVAAVGKALEIDHERSFSMAVENLMDRVAAHAEHQDQSVFPRVRGACSSRRLRHLGAMLAKARSLPALQTR